MGFRANSDNRYYDQKLDLRRTVLKEAKLGDLTVLDLFCGAGSIWRTLRDEFSVTGYMPVDKSPQFPGTVKANITPRFVAGLTLTAFNVIDVDCYGEPWELWLHLAQGITRKTVVFLTHGYMTVGRCAIGKQARLAAGLPDVWAIPETQALAEYCGQRALLAGAGTAHAARIHRWKMPQKVTYYGMLCNPKGRTP